VNEPGYKLDPEEGQARERLGLLESLEDPATIAHLLHLGVAAGWRCLEAGAGGGSIARWLKQAVGAEGEVVALDQETRLLEPLREDGIEVRAHDLTRDPLEEGHFDLVHTRNVLVHVPGREEVLRRLARAVRPGGWILLEEPDTSTDAADPTADPTDHALYGRVLEGIYRFLADAGLDTHFGAKAFGLLRAEGFAELRAEGRVHTYTGGGLPGGSPHLMAFAQMQAELAAAGVASQEELDRLQQLGKDPAFAWREGLLIATAARRPV
jgi:SAM-dependent methyltransferase